LYQRLLDIHPLDANNRYELGVTLMEMGAREDAVAQLERSIELQPDMMQNYHTLGYWMVFEYGRLDEALLLHRKSFAVNPETGHEAAPVAQSYAALGMREEALTFLEKALELLDWTPDVMFMAAHTHARLGDSDIAREHYERFVEAWGDRPHFSIPKIIVDIGLVTGQHEDALQRFRTRFPGSVNEDVIIDDDNFYGVFAYARLLQAAGYSDEARRRFERVAVFVESVCADDQDNLDCRYLPWQVYAHLGDRRKTLDWLRFAIVDKRYFANNHFFDTEALDFLRDDPEFRDLMGYVDAEMNKQRTRIREMECAGEIPRAPGIDTAAFCA
jgi:tetratricopeptide (TPR) repeat protein